MRGRPHPEPGVDNVRVEANLPTTLWAAVRHDLYTLFGSVANSEVRLAPGALLGISGGPTADFNMAFIDEAAGDEARFGEFIGHVERAGVAAVFMVSGACAPRLGPIARELGLVEAGSAPLMALDDPSPRPVDPGFAVHQVRDEKSLGVVADLVAAAFSLDREWVGRTFCSKALLEVPSLSFFLASTQGEPISAVTTTAGPNVVGIWSMATAPQHQRRGAGRAALLAAIDHHRRRGAKAFYLIATPAGKPLYDSVGFGTVDDCTLWIAGSSSQFPSH